MESNIKENLEESVKQEPAIEKDKPLVEKPLNIKVRVLRNSVIACYYIACGIFFGVMGYFAVSMIMAMFIPEASVLLGKEANAFSFGFAGIVGIMYYIFIIGLALIPIAIGFLFRNIKAKYVNVLKGANKENMEVVFARLEFFSMFIGELIINVILFCAIFICFTNNFTVVGILLSVTLVLAIIFMVLVIVDLIRNRVAYNKLSDAEREEIKVKIKSFRKVRYKKERKKRVGKLY